MSKHEAGKRILIVDDEDEICDFLRELLVEEGHYVEVASSGEKGVALGRESHFDLAIVDLKLQTAMSGLDVVQQLRQKNAAIKIIVITGYIDVALRHEAEKSGISHFAEKPTAIKPDIILPLVRKVLAEGMSK